MMVQAHVRTHVFIQLGTLFVVTIDATGRRQGCRDRRGMTVVPRFSSL